MSELQSKLIELRNLRYSLLNQISLVEQQIAQLERDLGVELYGAPGEPITFKHFNKVCTGKILRFESNMFLNHPVCIVEIEWSGAKIEACIPYPGDIITSKA